jgi:hypothetical protein
LPVGYEVFAGNTADVTTVEEMVELMEKKYGQAHRIWVMDRGMISQENIELSWPANVCALNWTKHTHRCRNVRLAMPGRLNDASGGGSAAFQPLNG